MTDINLTNLSQLRNSELIVEFGYRPSMPALAGITDHDRGAGLHLAAIHRMHLQDMNRMAAFLEQLKQGEITAV